MSKPILTSTFATAAAKNPLQTLFHHIYEPHPRSLNCTNYKSTLTHAHEPSHPLHTRTRRRMAAFDPQTFHWTVKCPVDVSKKTVVRNWVTRRVREAFRLELGRVGVELKGALCIRLKKEGKEVVTASGEEVRRQCGVLVRRLVGLQKGVGPEEGRRGGRREGVEEFRGKGYGRGVRRSGLVSRVVV